MKKSFKMLLMCMALVLPILFLPFMAKADDKDVKICVSQLPNNGTNEKRLMCGSSMIFTTQINSDEIDKDNASIDWNVTKKDGTPMQAVYEVINNGADLQVYAPYGYSEELEISVCVNGNAAWTDTYSFETQENEKMVGKTFFQFDTGNAEYISCNLTAEVWSASEKTYTITMPSVLLKNDAVQFYGWKCSNGNVYEQGEKVTLPKKDGGFVLVSAWYEVLDEPVIGATETPIMYTNDPVATSGPAVTVDSTETPQVSKIPSGIPEIITEPAVDATPVVTAEIEVTVTPETTVEPTVTTTPEGTTEPAESAAPVVTNEPGLTQTPSVTNTPEVTKVPETTGTPEVTNAPVVTDTPQNTIEPTVKPATDKVKTVSKVTAKKAGNRKITVSWGRVSNVKGYRIAYSTNKNFKSNDTKYKTITATKATITKLKKNKTYYVKVCAYKVVDGKKVYGTYSKVKKITLK